VSPSQQLRVLIVEDDFLVGEMVRGLLEDLGYSVVGTAGDGHEALDLAHKLRPDVVLMDIEMPRLDGIEATRLVLDQCPTPVVILSAYETPELVQRATEAGVGAYLVKPPKIREVERAIGIAIARFNDILTMRRLHAELEASKIALQEALEQVNILSTLLPVCASCKKIRDDEAYLQSVNTYLKDHPEAEHRGLCQECAARLLS
jgi:AmiR/NasT family two-component response regulator